ncbi:hypothetical protein [Sphaerisporangium rhizosphaerae]|uniref:DUF3800 domain-containing protein n=1 Tax=Sphaerisporangium rhizosphaerae TaxID=2269375 RepID=A0ABW2PBJ4_9ACTN
MHPLPSGLAGYIDESIHTDARLYVIGLVIIDPRTTTDIRSRLAVLVPAARPPHWSMEDEPTRAALIKEITSMSISARVYGCRFERPKRKEAARARALTWLVQDLPGQVRDLTLAQREQNQDRHDRKVLGGVAGRPPRFTYRHAAFAVEPALWLADIVVSCTARLLALNEDPSSRGLGEILTYVGCEPI